MDELADQLGMDPVELRLRNHADRHPTRDLPWSSKRTAKFEGGAIHAIAQAD